MPAQITCKFHKDLIKNERTIIYGIFQQSRANNSSDWLGVGVAQWLAC